MSLRKKSLIIAALLAGMTACGSDEPQAEAVAQPAEPAAAVAEAAPLASPVAQPALDAPLDTSDVEAVKQYIAAKLARNGLRVLSVSQAALPGIYQVQLDNLRFLYSDASAEYLVVGDMYQAAATGMQNLTELERATARKNLMDGISEKEMIVFAPKDKPVKGSVTVFTDVDCFYCQKLHQEVPALNEMGIAVRYLAFPRAGLDSPSYRKIASAWCADDPQDALTKLKNREAISENVCSSNPVAKELALGRQVGVTGTPALVLDDGRLLPGYLPADRLAQTIGIK